MLLELQYPYDKDYIKGYLIFKSNGRNIVSLFDKNNIQTSTSYSRYLMSIHLKRYLTNEEEVDHIDNDGSNDVIENLQILTNFENNKKRLISNKIGKKFIECICPNCDKTYSVDYRNCFLQPAKKQSISFCSRKCSYAFKRNFKITDLEKKQIGKEQLLRIYIVYHDNTIENIYVKGPIVQ